MSDYALYSRCPAVPTTSSLAYQLGLLQQVTDGLTDIDVDHQIVGLDPQIAPPYEKRLGLRHAGHAKAVWARAEGADTRIIACSWLEGTYPVYASRDSGISDAAGLKGRRLALVRFGHSVFDLLRAQQLKTYEAVLKAAGLTTGDVTFVDIDYDSALMKGKAGSGKSIFAVLAEDLAQRLVRGEVDAITAAVPPETADFLGFRLLDDTRNHADIRDRVNPNVLRSVVVSGALLRERRDLVVALVARLIEAADWGRLHPAEATELLGKDLGVPHAFLTATFGNLADGIQIGFSDDHVAALAAQKEFLVRHGFLSRDFALDEWIDRSVIEDARALLAARLQPASAAA